MTLTEPGREFNVTQTTQRSAPLGERKQFDSKTGWQHDDRFMTDIGAATRMLQTISTRLISETTLDSLYLHILDAAITLLSADAASVQMLDTDHESLLLLSWRNFHPSSAAFWQRVTARADSACGWALRDNRRVVVPDIESCELMAGTQDQQEYRRSGIRAVQSTPLCSRSGKPLGMLSTHWRKPHVPTEEDFRLFDVLARQAADLIERTLAEEALRESEERFRLITNTAPVTIWMTDAEKECTYVNQRRNDRGFPSRRSRSNRVDDSGLRRRLRSRSGHARGLGLTSMKERLRAVDG